MVMGDRGAGKASSASRYAHNSALCVDEHGARGSELRGQAATRPLPLRMRIASGGDMIVFASPIHDRVAAAANKNRRSHDASTVLGGVFTKPVAHHLRFQRHHESAGERNMRDLADLQDCELPRAQAEDGHQREAYDEQGHSGQVQAAEDEEAIPSTYCRSMLAVSR